MSMLMSMGGDASVEPWFADLPLSDPRCNNDSCTAYHQAHTASQAQISFESQFRYGWWLAWAYSIVIFLFVLAHAENSLMPRRFDASTRNSTWDKAIAMARKATYRRIPGRAAQFFALPSFGVLALMIFMFAGLTIMAFVQHPYYRGKRGYGSPPLGVRTGLMAFALIPLELALAGKVNPVTYLTGIGHEKLNVIHRWTGWAVLFLSVVHTIPFIVQPLREGGPSALHKQYYKAGGMEFTGTPPLGMIVGLALLSLPPLRRLAYELFVQVHLALAVAFLGLCFWHAAKSLDSWNYLWATVGIWLFSLMVRMTRKTSLFSVRGPFSQSQAVMTRLPHNMVRLDVSVKGTWNWEPGQHFFLRFLGLRPLDNHPFTVCNLPKHKDGRTVMTFLVRPHDGVTKRIGAVAERKTSIGVCVDGPYGTIIRPRIETRYQQAILVAGGGGISGVLPCLEHLASQIGKEGSSLKSVHLVWAVRTANCLSWAAEDVRAVQEQSSPGTVTYDVWVTDQNDASGETTETTDDKKAQVVNRGQEDALVHVSHFGQRPALAEVMPAVVGAGRSIVLGCGPESLKVDLSNVVASMQGEVINGRKQEVRLHTETFGW